MAEYTIQTYKRAPAPPGGSVGSPVPEEPISIGDDDQPSVLKDWFTASQAKAILDYAAAMKLTIGVGRLGESGVKNLKDGHPVRPHCLKDAQAIDAKFLQTQVYRLAQVQRLLVLKKPSDSNGSAADDIKMQPAQKTTGAQLDPWLAISFQPPSWLSKESDFMNSELAKKAYSSPKKEGNLLFGDIFFPFKWILDPKALNMSDPYSLPQPSEIRSGKSGVKPIEAAEGVCALWFELTVLLADDKKNFYPDIPAKTPAGRPIFEENAWTNKLKVFVPMAVFMPEEEGSEKSYKIKEITSSAAVKVFTKNTFVPGPDLRYLYQTEPSAESDTVVPFGSIGRPPSNEIVEYIYWLNLQVTRQKESESQKENPGASVGKGDTFVLNLASIKTLYLSVLKAEENMLGGRAEKMQMKEDKKNLDSRLGEALAVFTPDRKIHILSNKSMVKWWNREHKLWDVLAAAGKNFRDDTSGLQKEWQTAPRASAFGFPTGWTIDLGMGWDAINQKNFKGPQKEFRDAVTEIQVSSTVEAQVVALLRLPAYIHKVMDMSDTKGGGWRKCWEFVSNNLSSNPLMAAQVGYLAEIEEQAGEAARELVRYRAAEKKLEEEQGTERIRQEPLIKSILELLPSRKEFDDSLPKVADKDHENNKGLRHLLLTMEYARDLSLDDNANLDEINRIFCALLDTSIQVTPKISRVHAIKSVMTKELSRQKAKKVYGKTLNDLFDGNNTNVPITLAYDLFQTITSRKRQVSAKPEFEYPTVAGFETFNKIFNYATDTVDAASITKKAVEKGMSYGGASSHPSFSLMPSNKSHLSFLNHIAEVAGKTPCPAVFAFGSVSLLENMYRGRQVHKHLKIIKAFKNRLDREQKKIEKKDAMQNPMKDFDEFSKQLDDLDKLKVEPMRKYLKNADGTARDDLASGILSQVLDGLEDRKGGSRKRRGGRVFLAAGAMALLVAGVVTGGAAVVAAGVVVGAVKTMEGINKKLRDFKSKLALQIEREAHIVATSAQLGNPIAIELGVILFLTFDTKYGYQARYRAVEHGMKYSDWYDAYVEGYKSFAKVK